MTDEATRRRAPNEKSSARTRTPVAIAGLLVLVTNVFLGAAHAQDVRYSFEARDVPLELALQRFAEKTGINVTYLSEAISHHQVFCVMATALPEEILRCLLQKTELDYIRLSTGTYAIVRSSFIAPEYGSLNGRVVTAGTNIPIAYAHVVLSDLGYGTTTDHTGRFVLPPLLPGAYQLSASYMGFAVWQDTVHIEELTSHTLAIPLIPETFSLEPIVVDALPYAQMAEELRYGTLSAEELLDAQPAYGAVNILQQLSAENGIHFSPATSDLHIQAGTAGEHQIRLDGSPVFLPQQLAGIWGPFNPLAIEQIRIHKSGFGVKMGSFQSGVIEANHRLDPPKGKHVSVHLAPLTFNMLASTGLNLSKKKRLNLMAAWRHDLWPAYIPPSVRTGLASWSAGDTFLLEAPLYLGSALRKGDPDIYSDIADLVRPDLSFDDFHTAINLQFSTTTRLYASFYRGNLGVATDEATANLDVHDEYRWNNASGQVSFETVPGARTMLAFRARSSKFHLDHNYRLLDQLNIFNDKNQFEAQTLIEQPIADQNRIIESALAADLTYAHSSNHQLQGGIEFVRTHSRFQLVASHTLSLVDKVLSDAADSLEAVTRQFEGNTDIDRAAIYLEDKWRLSPRTSLLSGIRWTWLTTQSGQYIEPRIALEFTGLTSSRAIWVGRVAAGLYHQFVTQYDLGTANIGAILPSLRFWLPTPKNVRPPQSIHFSATSKLSTDTDWTLQLEVFTRIQPHTLIVKQLPFDDFFDAPAAPEKPSTDSFLEAAHGTVSGVSTTVEKNLKNIRLSINLEWNRARRTSPSYFGGRSITPPWTHPFRSIALIRWQITSAISVQAAGQGIWGRRWAFRQVYYDNLGHIKSTSMFPPFDLSRPESHRLSPHHQTDVSIRYVREHTFPIQFEAGILNLFDRRNEADRRLKFDRETGLFTATPRRVLPAFSPYLRFSVSW